MDENLFFHTVATETAKAYVSCNIKHEIRQLKNGFVDIATYPNGIELVITNINGTTHVEPSKPLVKIDELTYQIPE